MQSKWSLTWYDPLGPRMCVLELMNGHVLQTLREQLKVPGSRLGGSELLTSEFLRFRSRLNETSGGLGKIGAVSGSDCRILKFLRTASEISQTSHTSVHLSFCFSHIEVRMFDKNCGKNHCNSFFLAT